MVKLLLVSPILSIIPVQSYQVMNYRSSWSQESYTYFKEVYRTLFNDEDLDGSNFQFDYNYQSSSVATTEDTMHSGQMHTEKYGWRETNDAYYNYDNDEKDQPTKVGIDVSKKLNKNINNQMKHGMSSLANHPDQKYIIYKIGFTPKFHMLWQEWHHQDSSHDVYHNVFAWFSDNFDNSSLNESEKGTGSPINKFDTTYGLDSDTFSKHLSQQEFINKAGGHSFEDENKKINTSTKNYVWMGFREHLHSEFKHMAQEEDLYASANSFQVNIEVFGGWVNKNWNPKTQNINYIKNLMNQGIVE